MRDRVVQATLKHLLEPIFEPTFSANSYGFRPGRSQHQAIEAAREIVATGKPCVVDLDLAQSFDHMDHDWVVRMLGERIDDRAFLGLIRKWLKAGILDTDGAVYEPDEGTPQGGIISPVLANIYLHYALDLWVERVVKPRCRSQVRLYRYADDFVCVFSSRAAAERFYGALPKRLEKFALEVAPEKTRIVSLCRLRPDPSTRIVFLGFELYWHCTFKGSVRLMRRTARKRLQRAVRSITDWIRSHRHLPVKEFVKELNRRLIGHYNDYGLRGNASDPWSYFHAAVVAAYKWLNRRGGKRASFTREVFLRALKRLGAARPRITEQSIVQCELVLV